MQEHQGTPLERTLRARWLIYLANRKQAQLFLKNYQYGSDVVLGLSGFGNAAGAGKACCRFGPQFVIYGL